MTLRKRIPIILGLALLAILVLFNTTYTVGEHEIAIVSRLGRPAEVVDESGLHLKAPFFIDQVTTLDTRLQLIESPLETVLTKDGQQVVAQAFLLWRINPSAAQALDFHASFGELSAAEGELETRLQGALRLLGGFEFNQLIGTSSKIGDAEAAILADLQATSTTGIEVVKVGISQLVLPPKTTVAVLRRMSAVQETLGNLEESKGAAAADAIKSMAATQADTIRAFTSQWAAEIEAKGAEEAATYYEQMRSEAELAIFLAWLDTLKASLSGSTTFVGDMSRPPFHLLDPDAPISPEGIPVPPPQAGKQ
ncbi:MAG: SPFH domain-containing protein [Planctomycetota bacterium]|nr:SPFH domain-containing protein [Planctomycetota bacterium]MDA1104985.1 SPFH domain-containing protein [Planctomycetota bacterium]